MEVTLIYWANGGDSTPASETKEIVSPATTVAFTLAGEITREAPTRKYIFRGWDVNGMIYNAGDTVNLSAGAVAKAVFGIRKTTVSTKDYGRSPNGTRNAIGRTRFHHQPSYPHAMGVGAKRIGNPPEAPVPPTPPTVKEINVEEAMFVGGNSGELVGAYLDNVSTEEFEGEQKKVVYWKQHGSASEYVKAYGDTRSATSLRLFETTFTIGEYIDVKLTSDASPITPGVPASKEYLFESILVERKTPEE